MNGAAIGVAGAVGLAAGGWATAELGRDFGSNNARHKREVADARRELSSPASEQFTAQRRLELAASSREEGPVHPGVPIALGGALVGAGALGWGIASMGNGAGVDAVRNGVDGLLATRSLGAAGALGMFTLLLDETPASLRSQNRAFALMTLGLGVATAATVATFATWHGTENVHSTSSVQEARR